MPNKVLIIEPHDELKFKLDYSGLLEIGFPTYLRLINPSTDTVMFKIKTTKTKSYCVRPNSGVLEPNSKMDIAITPQPVYVAPDEKHKHKFLIESVIAPVGQSCINQVWEEVSPDQFMLHKLRCVFETPSGINRNNDAQNKTTKKIVAVTEDAKSSIKDSLEVFTQSEATEQVKNDLQKAASEIIYLREQAIKLSQENLQLKKELHQASEDVRDVKLRHSYEPEKTLHVGFMLMIAGIGISILGILIGKFFM